MIATGSTALLIERDALKARVDELETDAGLWRALKADCDADPCRYPCLRDDLHDWLQSRVCAADGHLVSTSVEGVTEEQAKANARLIAAAPELLETLNRLLAAAADVVIDEERTGALRHGALEGRMDCARAAIAKATGR